MPAQYNLTSTYDLNIAGDKLFLKMDPGYKMIVLDKVTGAVIKDDELIHPEVCPSRTKGRYTLPTAVF